MLIQNSKKIFFCLLIQSSASFANDEIEDDSEVDFDNIENEYETKTPEKAVGISLGEAHPWQLLGVNFLSNLSNHLSLNFFSGAGFFSQNAAQLRGSEFESRAFFSTIGTELRYFPSKRFPIFLNMSGAFHSIDGKVSPRAFTVEDKLSSGQNFLTSRFQAQALSLETGIGFSYEFFERFFLDWNIVSVKHSFAGKIKIEDTVDDRSHAVRVFIESTRIFGIVNVSLGMTF